MKNKSSENIKIAFFGTPQVAVYVLDELKKAGIVPDIIITAPDMPAGRKLILTPPLVKTWADENNIKTLQPKTLKDSAVVNTLEKAGPWDLFIVAAYGKLIPKDILDIPNRGTLNMHPSLLPRLRGASPIQSSILTENETGVTIMEIDEEMDHGPIISQEKVKIPDWPPKASELEEILSMHGGKMLAKVIPDWINKKITSKEQNHDDATFTKKIKKEDGFIDLKGKAQENYRKIQAFNIWPRTYFFTEKNGKKIRVIITNATLENGKLIIKKVIPEGKKEMDYSVFLNS